MMENLEYEAEESLKEIVHGVKHAGISEWNAKYGINNVRMLLKVQLLDENIDSPLTILFCKSGFKVVAFHCNHLIIFYFIECWQ
jgi:hypothetical protein